ncbi:hypothetical protein [Brevibacillus laterosporus]|uniref:hypothetical protein n=1 Tax=Brevibacillus laterosporus TaxID=1465 RepID=UPI0013C51296|nr:hypothetical protein [Brevibacillus laterosporus]MBM7109988.1 hypothetical protein [Brevibacillus laterosporus]
MTPDQRQEHKIKVNKFEGLLYEQLRQEPNSHFLLELQREYRTALAQQVEYHSFLH